MAWPFSGTATCTPQKHCLDKNPKFTWANVVQDPKVAGPSSGSSGRGAKSSSSSGGSGSLTTEAASSSRATVSTAALHASKYWPQASVSGGTHSRKYYDRRAAYLNVSFFSLLLSILSFPFSFSVLFPYFDPSLLCRKLPPGAAESAITLVAT